MEEKDIVNTTAEELSSAKPDYEKEIASIIRSNASPAQIKDKLLDYHENDIAAALDSMSISERQRLYARTAADGSVLPVAVHSVNGCQTWDSHSLVLHVLLPHSAL